MLFNSLHFLVFFPIVLLVFFFIKEEYRVIWLLIASYYFYMSWSPKYIVLIGFSTVSTFIAAKIISWSKSVVIRKIVLYLGLISNMSILFFFKYWNFAVDSVLSVTNKEVISWLPHTHFALPVGISFFTFQAVGYLIDVYKKTIVCEEKITNYALFVAFFPQLVAGPIEKASKLQPQIQNIKNVTFDYNRFISGIITMLYGLFIKIVIADNLAVYVNLIIDNYNSYSSVILMLGALFFSIQIYCDFYGYSLVAIGAAQILGVELSDNFRMPYFALSLNDFWKRWHISLSSWFREYVYIPLGGNRKGKLIKDRNLLITFLMSGLWHGASWNFVFWGGLHGIVQIVENHLPKIQIRNLYIDRICKSIKFIVVFVCVSLAWIYFRITNVREATDYIARMFSNMESESQFTPNVSQICVIVISIFLLFIIDYICDKEHKHIGDLMINKRISKYVVIDILCIVICVFGNYGPNIESIPFLYFQF